MNILIVDDHAINRKLLAGPLYGFLFKLVPLTTVLKGAQSRWGQLHRGVALATHFGESRNKVVFRLVFPPNVVPRLLASCYATAYQAALELTGTRNPKVVLVDHTATGAQFDATWEL